MKRKYSMILAVILLLLISILSSCSVESTVNPEQPTTQKPTAALKVHFIDVGQGDSIFIQLANGETVLIDGGNKADAEVIMNYLQSLNVKMIDYLIATHPHEDHIGSLPAIIRDFSIGSIYMPKVTANTKIFEDLLLSIKAKGYKINTAAAGVKIIDTKETQLTILAPNSAEYDDMNNYSAVAKLVYRNTSFLFTGDAEDVSEKEILKNNYDLKADVIKVGHHGGRTSNTEDFLSKAAPDYAVISVGKDNDYGHPHAETIERLSALNLKIFRTDEQGTIVASSDGNSVTIDKAPIAVKSSSTLSSEFYIGNKNSKIYHLTTCSGLPKLENQVKLTSKSEAQSGGYEPCKICKP
ncbi:MAG: fold metallo-hydrolase [Clostridia bacterium]|jgi:competence protein ComEC|nr:fold metallo-hydrolase [Clostridia bacterium]